MALLRPTTRTRLGALGGALACVALLGAAPGAPAGVAGPATRVAYAVGAGTPATAPGATGAGDAAVASPAQAPWAGCPGQEAPPPPAAVEETTAVAPLPWPAEPVGGPALGGCGDIGPAGVPPVAAASYIVADLDSGAVLAARAPHARHRPASTLKVLLALVAVRHLSPDATVAGAASDLAIDGSKAGIGPGGTYTVRQLLDALLLNSGNDAAEALSRALDGRGVTLTTMTDTARSLGALDTRPATPSGLDGPGMAMSAYDLAAIFRVALREPLFASTIALHTVDFPGYGDKPGFVLANADRVRPNYPGTIGAKSGFTDAARHTIVAAADRNGRRLVVAVMRTENRPAPDWKQATALLDWGFAQPPGPGVGTLVDTAPPQPTPAPVALAAPGVGGAAQPAPAWQLPALVGGAVVVAAGAVAVAVRRRRG